MNIPKGFVLIPSSMLLSKEVIEIIAGHCGDGDQMFGEYTDGLLWVGELEGDDGEKKHGLHIMTEEYPEEGSSTLVEFEAPQPPAYDEAKEINQFLNYAEDKTWFRPAFKDRDDSKMQFSDEFTDAIWIGWIACAQSRAQRGEV